MVGDTLAFNAQFARHAAALRQGVRKANGRPLYAARLRAETTKTLKWIAKELHMGAWTHVSNLVSHHRRKAKP